MFNLLTKVYPAHHGTILLDGLDTRARPPPRSTEWASPAPFQNIRLFNNLSVEDNVKIGLHNQEKYSALERRASPAQVLAEGKAAHDRALELLSIFDMQDLAGHKAGSLPTAPSAGWEIVRALATNLPCCCWTEAGPGMA